VSRQGGKKQATVQLERERMHRRYDLAKWTVAPFIWIVSTWVPLQAAIPMAEALSGHKTTLTVTFSITLAVSITASLGLIAMFMRARKAEREVERMRDLIEEFEGEKRR
jgi:hypothetical protein